MAMKLDMSKAYDRVEWGFVKCVMLKMGYPAKIVGLIMNCISSVSYQILANGQPSISFRQGDPLSPYLFIICSDVLSSLMHNASADNLIHGIQVARNAPKISYLMFIDDSLLFSRANKDEPDPQDS